MAYMNQERKAKIVAACKPILKKYGMKGTFKCDRFSITLTLKSGAIDFVSDMVAERINFGQRVTIDKSDAHNRAFEINPYWFSEHYTEGSKSAKFIADLIPALKAADWYDRSDIMTDYFDTAYYYNIKVGWWDQPYTVV